VCHACKERGIGVPNPWTCRGSEAHIVPALYVRIMQEVSHERKVGPHLFGEIR